MSNKSNHKRVYKPKMGSVHKLGDKQGLKRKALAPSQPRKGSRRRHTNKRAAKAGGEVFAGARAEAKRAVLDAQELAEAETPS